MSSNRVIRSVASVLLTAAPLTVTLLSSPAPAAAVPVSAMSGESASTAKEKPDPAWKERYERVHEPREASEQRELARERRAGGR